MPPGTSQATLHDIFAKYGPISRITVRCSQGQYVTATVVPKKALTSRDRHYASIEFFKPDSARRALEEDGTVIGGRQVIVSHNLVYFSLYSASTLTLTLAYQVTVSVADLPEVADITNRKLILSGFFLLESNVLWSRTTRRYATETIKSAFF